MKTWEPLQTVMQNYLVIQGEGGDSVNECLNQVMKICMWLLKSHMHPMVIGNPIIKPIEKGVIGMGAVLGVVRAIFYQ